MDTPLYLSKRKSAHVLVFASRGKGHINPAATLSSKLASLGISVTIILPDTTSYTLLAQSSIGKDLDIALAKLPLKEEEEYKEDESIGWTMEGIRTGIRSGYEMPFDYSSQQRALNVLLEELKTSHSPPCCIIVDILLAWSEEVINKHGLPRFILYTAAATYLNLVLHARQMYKEGTLPVKGGLETLKVKGLPTLQRWDIPDAITDDTHTVYLLHMGWIDHLVTSDGMLFNTFEEFESSVFHALRSDFEELNKCPMLLPVGPLLPDDYFGSEVLHATKSSILKSPEEDRCQTWLDEQPTESVLYISFGSWALLSPKQAYEVAVALETTQQRFIWVLPVKKVQELEEMLPKDFLDKTSNQGLVLPGWGPQHLILSHPSTGGFLTHCGWNSTLEAVTLAGIPVIGWPFLADQPPNCRYLVDGAGIASEVHGDDDGFVTSKEIERAIWEITKGPQAEIMRSRTKDLKAAAKKAIQPGGSSYKNLQYFVSKIKSF